MPLDSLAYDRSVRRYDEEGRLHVELTPISKTNVCPYYGREIPGAEILGLDPNRIYQLFRDPEELAKAASTANNIQVMQEHTAVTAGAPKQMEVVGTTGEKAVFDPPYLLNSLAIWVKSAIELIESDKKKQLSCAYHYIPDMTPGFYQGVRYDGVMRNIRFNHVALVEDGRAGADVMVADSLPLDLINDFDEALKLLRRILQGLKGRDPAFDAEFNESDHPRDDDGKFGSGGGGGAQRNTSSNQRVLESLERLANHPGTPPHEAKLAREKADLLKSKYGLKSSEISSSESKSAPKPQNKQTTHQIISASAKYELDRLKSRIDALKSKGDLKGEKALKDQHKYLNNLINSHTSLMEKVEKGEATKEALEKSSKELDVLRKYHTSQASKHANDKNPDSLKLNTGANKMPNVTAAISRKAQIARGALAIYMKPKLAQDQAIDLKQVLVGATAANWNEFKATILDRMTKAVEGKLAADASLEDMHGLLDSLDREGEDEEDTESEEDKKKREAADKAAKDKAARDRRAVDKAVKDKAVMDEEEETAEEKAERMVKRKAASDRKALDTKLGRAATDKEFEDWAKEEEDESEHARDAMITKPAMDAAIKSAVEASRQEMKEAQKALREAEAIVAPVLGKLAMDSAEDVYAALFKHEKVDVTGVTGLPALRALATVTVRATTGQKKQPMAMDTKVANDFHKRFPEIARIRTI